jgi:hypothetical protein
LNALAANPPQYVTVVLDSAAPGLNNPQARLSGHAAEVGGVYTYGENSSLTLTIDRMNSLSDNALEGGIADNEATGKPWTKDRHGDLEWRVVFESDFSTKRHESIWQSAEENTYTVTNTQTELFNDTTLDRETAYEVKLQFRDRMGNSSDPQPTGLSVQYSNQAAMIGNLADLVAFRDMVNNGGVTAGKEYVLAADIRDVTNWTPIGTDTDPFMGTFNGNGYRISIDSIAEAADMGLFGVVGKDQVEGGTVRDLTVEYGGASVTPAGAFRFGGIAGTAQGNALFEEVQVLGSVTTGGSGNTAYVGGLIGLMTGTARMTNAYGGLKLTVKTNPDYPNSLYAGGAVGSMGSPDSGDAVRVEGASVEGDLIVGSQNVPVNGLSSFVGGLSGFIAGSGDAEESRAKLLNSDYRRGNIEVWSGSGSVAVGGAIGRIFEYATVKGCSSLAGNFAFEKNGNGPCDIGGFAGMFFNSGTLENCYSGNQMVTSYSYSSYATGNYIHVGGFVGLIGAGGINESPVNISYCYALGAVSVTGYTVYAGGFAAYMNPSASASYCYAAGDVYVYDKQSSALLTFVGGFAGKGSNFKDCYALGKVFADKTVGSEALMAGAFVGNFNDMTDYSLHIMEHCFAAGSVTAQRDTSGTINAGGLVGYMEFLPYLNEPLKNSAALGASVTATGPGTRKIGRVFGLKESGVVTQGNYANNNMMLYSDNIYAKNRPAEMTPAPTPGPDNEHGEDANTGMFHNPAFWRDTLGFSAENWDFSAVVSEGHPRLRASPGGPAMGGQ